MALDLLNSNRAVSNAKSGDDKLLTKAKQAANEAVPLSAAFVDHGSLRISWER